MFLDFLSPSRELSGRVGACSAKLVYRLWQKLQKVSFSGTLVHLGKLSDLSQTFCKFGKLSDFAVSLTFGLFEHVFIKSESAAPVRSTRGYFSRKIIAASSSSDKSAAFGIFSAAVSFTLIVNLSRPQLHVKA